MIDAARELARELPGYRASHDTERRLAAPVVERVRGFLGALVPRELGGNEITPMDYVRVLEALATGDSATAWCVMTSTTTAVLSAYLPRATAAAVCRDMPFMAGAFAPMGKLRDGRLTGRWSYVSGSRHAAWFALGVIRDGGHAFAMVPAVNVSIVDNWDTLGLAGTGSHDVTVDVPVADDHVVSVFGHVPWSDGPLYKMPLFGLLAVGIAACGLGIAGSAVGHASQLGKDPSSYRYATWARTRARLDAARAMLVAAVDGAYRQQPAVTNDESRGQLRLAASHVASEAAEIVRASFHIVGGAAVRAGHPVQAALRDIETLLTHRMVADRVVPAAARAILGGGAPPDL
ncbi:MAG TPA: acyl-CoA dehydrogenase family protein [Kofleriaceae bacterium]|jgi:alkylation response protein AidB-like acyl-CoA dehydrogenase|nr:acyl-CoA dehydrogenase family protein [Kofleriaceae bacterium]